MFHWIFSTNLRKIIHFENLTFLPAEFQISHCLFKLPKCCINKLPEVIFYIKSNQKIRIYFWRESWDHFSTEILFQVNHCSMVTEKHVKQNKTKFKPFFASYMTNLRNIRNFFGITIKIFPYRRNKISWICPIAISVKQSFSLWLSRQPGYLHGCHDHRKFP